MKSSKNHHGYALVSGDFFWVNLTFCMSAEDNMASDNNDVASDNADELLRI